MAIRALLNLWLKNSSKKHSKWYNVAEHLHDFAGKSRRFLIHFQKRSKSKISIGSKNFVTKGLYFDRRLTSDASNSKNKLSDLRRLFGLARPEALRIAGAVVLLFVSSGVTMTVPFAMGKIIDIIYTENENDTIMKETLTSFSKILCGVFLVGAVANAFRVYLIYTSGERIIYNLRYKLFQSITNQEIAFFDKRGTGELVNRLSGDTSLVGHAITYKVSDGLRALVQGTAGMSMMYYTSPKLASVVMGIVPPVAVISVVYGRYLRGITRKVRDLLAISTNIAEESLSNIRTVQAFGQEETQITRYQSKIGEVFKLTKKEAIASGIFWGFTGLSGNLIVLLVLYFGGNMVSLSQITVGGLTSFMVYAAWVGVSVSGLSSFYSELMKGVGASSRLWQLLDREPRIARSAGLSLSDGDLRQGIEFRNVHFKYSTRPDVPIFSSLNLFVPARRVTAVVGPSGSGKSTITSLLLRFYDVDSGSILIGEHDIRSLKPDWLREHIGIVSQEPVLFSGSIRDNIAFAWRSEHGDLKFEDVMNAAKQANALQFIQSFPQGFETVVGEKGLALSGGQRQRIAIARALLKNPKILVLDEATSALDAESEHLVQEAMDRLMKDRTVITIAHRLSTIKNAHNIVVLDRGKILQSGTYFQLTQDKDGLFYKLIEKQTLSNFTE
ncbi:ATP-binding cassette sub-family B member 10, mitochondrial-like [Xenia sp. Carnegie-2017]|uniref:ATP-binding cassette sub-family B member 10, mitochondrial-like n=1 Tax=Xenia sp. Carnegie-2017 TaxID=2897299 RepID=UPI001F04052A|nr:ATP-binding cassette sub-family B member 10, mitochondrial-like [Xenia sp. Carnegie-2017]